MSGEQQADVRTSVGVDKVVVHELSRGGVAHHDAGAKAQRQRHGHDGGEGESAARDRWTEGRRARGVPAVCVTPLTGLTKSEALPDVGITSPMKRYPRRGTV